MILTRIYYILKPFIPRSVQIYLRRVVIRIKRKYYSSVWPIDPPSAQKPTDWQGWPGGAKFALVLTHDVDTQKGHDNCLKLAEIEQKHGFLSSFNFVPERYRLSAFTMDSLRLKGHEIGVHGLKHDGKLYSSRDVFLNRAKRINQYLVNWRAKGFRSPAMHHNLDWLHDLNILYDASTFDTDPFEPQSDGVRTIFPFYVNQNHGHRGYIELPYTLAQDFTLFVLLQEQGISIWTQKLEWIVNNGGMVLLNVHPDYIDFNGSNLDPESYPVTYYEEFLKYVKIKFKNQYWNALPCDVATFAMKTYGQI